MAFFRAFSDRLVQTGHHWTSNTLHGALLRSLQEYGAALIAEEELNQTVRWLTLCYVGEPGGYGAGIDRRVF